MNRRVFAEIIPDMVCNLFLKALTGVAGRPKLIETWIT
jgi:hypothetical protein